MWNIWQEVEVPVGLHWGNLREINHLEDFDTQARRLLQLILKKWVVGVHWTDLWACTGLICGRALD
jgi:hypothetical protein